MPRWAGKLNLPGPSVWAVKVQFSRILNAQRHRPALHALLRAAEMGRQNIFPPNLFLCKKPVGRLRFSPAVAGMGNAGRRLVCQPIQQRDGTLVEPGIAQIRLCRFLRCFFNSSGPLRS